MITVPNRHRQTDGQTDRQTDRRTTYDGNTALCTKVHCAVKTLKNLKTFSKKPRFFPALFSEEVAIQIAKNCRRRQRQPHSHLTPPPRVSANIRMHLKFQDIHYRVIGLHLLSLIVWVYRHSNLCSGLQKTHLFGNSVRFGRSRSIILVPIESAYATSY